MAPAMLDFLRHPPLLSCIERLVGPEIIGSSVYRIRPKLPRWDHGEVPWHQDSGYLLAHCDAYLIVTCWIPLVDATLDNGCLHVLPGVHRGGILRHYTGGHAGYLEVPDGVLPEVTPVALEMGAGDVLFMTNFTPHASFGNHSGQVRWSLDLRYQGTDAPTNIGEGPEDYTPEREPVTMACYPPEADFVIRDDRHPEREITQPRAVPGTAAPLRRGARLFARSWLDAPLRAPLTLPSGAVTTPPRMILDWTRPADRARLREIADRYAARSWVGGELAAAMARFMDDLRARGDAAVADYLRRHTRGDYSEDAIRVAPETIAAAGAALDPEAAAALRRAADNVRAYQAHVKPADPVPLRRHGAELGLRHTPVASAGLSVPGGGRRLSLHPGDAGGPGAGRGSAAAGRGHAAAQHGGDGGDRPHGAGRVSPAGHRHGVPRRRVRAGSPRCRHRTNRAGGDDRRPQQHLRPGGQAPALRRGRHRRPLRSQRDRGAGG